MVLFSQTSNATIINSYTALYEDGSKLVVDLKGYDYGEGSYYAAPWALNESNHPSVEGFETIYYPFPDSKLGTTDKPGDTTNGDGLYFTVDEFGGVSMNDFYYSRSTPDYTLSDFGLYVSYIDYETMFLGGFFDTAVSPYPVDEGGSLMLMVIGLAGLRVARLRRKIA